MSGDRSDSGTDDTVAPPVSGLDATIAPKPISGLDATVAPNPSVDPTLASDAPTGEVRIVARGSAGREAYAIGVEIARGGMGRIVVAFDRRIGRNVALKELLVASPAMLDRFKREALITGQLQHPSIVPVYEVGALDSGEAFYAMKHVSGRPLDAEIARCANLAERLALLPKALAICQAVAYAHRQGIIHRDLKPANVLVGDFGETVVIDWGLAKRVSDPDEPARPVDTGVDENLTAFGAVMGTPAYMPPEQARGEPVDARADIYSLGAILRQILTGKTPYTSKTTTGILEQVIRGSLAPLAESPGEIPLDLVAIVDRAMAIEPDARYQAADDLVADLQRYLDGRLVGAHTYSTFALVRRWIRRHRGSVAVAAVAILALGVLGAMSYVRVTRERDAANAAKDEADAAKVAALAREQEALAAQRLAEARALIGAARAAVAMHRPEEAVALLRAAARPELGEASLEEVGRAGIVDLASISIPRIVSIGTDSVEAVAFSPDGKRLVAGTTTGRVVVLDASTGSVIASGEHPSDSTWGVRAVAFSPDGRSFASAGAGENRVWDATTNKPIQTHASSARLSGVWFSPDGSVLAAKEDDRRVGLYRASGEPIAVVDGNASAVAFAPDGSAIATATLPGGVLLSDTRTGRTLHFIPVASVGLAIAVSPDGRRVVASFNNGDIRLFDLAKTPVLLGTASLKDAAAGAVAFSRDGSTVIARDHMHLILYDGKTLAPLSTIEVGGDNGLFEERIAVSGDGHLIAAHAGFNAVGLWDAASGLRIGVMRGDTTVDDFAFSADGKQLAVALQDGKIQIWALHALAPEHTLARSASPGRVALSPDGSIVAVGHEQIEVWHDGKRQMLDDATGRGFVVTATEVITYGMDGVRIWDPATGKQLATLIDRKVSEVSLAPDRVTLAVIPDGRGETELWNLERRERRTSIPVAFDGMAWSHDATLLAGGGTNLPSIWDLRANAAIALEGGPDEVMHGIGFSHDKRWIAAGYEDRSVAIWDLGTKKLVRTIADTGPWGVYSVEFSPDDERLAVGHNNRASLWSRSSGALIARLVGSEQLQGNPMFLPDGRMITPSQAAHLWDGRTGATLGMFASEGPGMSLLPALSLSLDGSRFVTQADGNETAGVFVWRVPPAMTVVEARDRSGRESNLRPCRDSYNVVAVIPSPGPDVYWAPDALCRH